MPLNSIPLSLYIHFPWCVQKCPYCDFNSHTLKDSLPEEVYIDQLLKDLDADLPKVISRSLQSIFMGGGTPSLFSPEAIARLLKSIQARIPFSKNIEITLEANPGTVEQTRFEGYREAGVNRLSIGVQSFAPDKLKTLGRIHGQKDAIKAALAAKNAGFENFNLDLMFGLPEQSLTNALEDLHKAIELKPPHLSWYQLTLEPNTLFYHQPPVLPQDEQIYQMYLAGVDLLKKHGYAQYEVSAYSQNGKRCLHNRNYWEFGDYLGIGAGAHSKITDLETQQITRFSKLKHPKAYLKNSDSFVDDARVLTEAEKIFEFMLNALRLYQPIPYTLFEARTGLHREKLLGFLQKAADRKLLTYDNISFAPTEQGRLFLDDLVTIFLA